jgi:dTDP-4-dehydrorhamnose 3,5-epimerase
MRFKNGYIEGIRVDRLVKNVDRRGFLVETYRADGLPEGLAPQMSYVSYTEPGVARGPHEHLAQTDIFVFMGPGEFRIRLWDNRKTALTFLNTMTVLAGESNPVRLIVPPGIVHAYKNTSKALKGMVLNYPDRLYRGWGRKDQVDEIRHEDQGDEFFVDFMKETE